jgi:PIN domain nuclease of toxin-antitoxin system
VRILLDTHIFLWLQTEPEKLGDQLALVEDEGNDLLFSAASSWEIAIKYGIGRLPLPEPPERYVPARMGAIGAQPFPVEHSHALAVAALPPLHDDPFDRLLVAQAGALGVPLMTSDERVSQYEVETLAV